MVAVLLLLFLQPPEPPPARPWAFDVLHTRAGYRFLGLIVDETPTQIRFKNVRRQPGRPTLVFTTTFAPAELVKVERLAPDDRAALAQRLAELDLSGDGERRRMEKLELQPAPWLDQPAGAWRYAADHFVLTSNAPAEVVRRAAVRLEQLYLAFGRFLPPTARAGTPTAVVLVRSLPEYRDLLRREGRTFLNEAFYDPVANRLVCGSDLARLGEELELARTAHQQIIADVAKLEAELATLPRKKVPPHYPPLIRDTRARIALAEQANERAFAQATQQLFTTLYHEAFHAYLLNFVYPLAQGELPRWLNEGLAQLFETAIVEGGELRVGHADRERLLRAKDELAKGQLPGLAELARGGVEPFTLNHDRQRQAASRAYLAAWAAAHLLAFDQRLLGSAALDQYVAKLKRGDDAAEALAGLVGKPLAEFDKEFRKYVERLQPDGTLTDLRPGK